MAKIRCFIAIPVPERIRERCLEIQTSLQDSSSVCRWVDPKNFHLTLNFLGEIDELQLVSACQIVKKLTKNHPPFQISLTGVGCFPNLRRPKVLWIGVNLGADICIQLQSELSNHLAEEMGYRPEDRKFHPHLTMARIGTQSENLSWPGILKPYESQEFGEWNVDEIVVMESDFSRSSPDYHVLSRGVLAAKN